MHAVPGASGASGAVTLLEACQTWLHTDSDLQQQLLQKMQHEDQIHQADREQAQGILRADNSSGQTRNSIKPPSGHVVRPSCEPLRVQSVAGAQDESEPREACHPDSDEQLRRHGAPAAEQLQRFLMGEMGSIIAVRPSNIAA